jgi:sortase A
MLPLQVTQRSLLIGGVLAMGFTAYTYAARYAWQKYDSTLFDNVLTRRLAASDRADSLRAADPTLIGRIIIPRLGISAMVREGVDERTLGLAVGHIPTTALPGQTGNAGFAAHRDNLFRNLKDVRQNDSITVTTIDHTYVYRVVSFRVVYPTEVSVLDPSSNEKILTLVTCYPFYFVGHAPRRFIVRALQIG